MAHTPELPRCAHCGRLEADHGTLGWCDPLLVVNLSISSYSGPGSLRFSPVEPNLYHRALGEVHCRICGRLSSDPLHHPAGRLDGCTCDHIAGSHRSSCPWSLR